MIAKLSESKTLKVLWVYGPWILWMAITYYLSDLPGEQVLISHTDWVERDLKNGLHFIEYFGLYIMSWRVMSFHKVRKANLVALVWCALYAGSDEIHQLSTLGREASWSDLMIDVSGSTLAMVSIRVMGKFPILRKFLELE